jgi:hypothetical protein
MASSNVAVVTFSFFFSSILLSYLLLAPYLIRKRRAELFLHLRHNTLPLDPRLQVRLSGHHGTSVPAQRLHQVDLHETNQTQSND